MESSGCAREPRCFRRSEKGQRECGLPVLENSLFMH